jgi:hypothetical protein
MRYFNTRTGKSGKLDSCVPATFTSALPVVGQHKGDSFGLGPGSNARACVGVFTIILRLARLVSAARFCQRALEGDAVGFASRRCRDKVGGFRHNPRRRA